MTAKTGVTKAAAERVLCAVKERHTAYVDKGTNEPELVKDAYGAPFAVVWEGGPFEWAISFPNREVDEELTAEMRAISPTYTAWMPDVSARLPEDVEVEAYSGYVVTIRGVR